MENAGEVHENCKILRRTIKTNNEETLLESDARRSQIAEAVLYIMENYGADAVTVRRVAKLVGVTGAALYRYYKSKTDVLMAVLEQQYGMLVENSHKALKEAQGSLDFLKIFYRYNMDIVVRYRMLPIFFLLDSIMLDEDHSPHPTSPGTRRGEAMCSSSTSAIWPTRPHWWPCVADCGNSILGRHCWKRAMGRYIPD